MKNLLKFFVAVFLLISLFQTGSGDLNQDGAIDLNDLETIDNDIVNSITGNNIASDLNGDNLVDLEDLSVCDNNAFDFISIIKP